MSTLNPLKLHFHENVNIGPSVADFRRFLLHCQPRPTFRHYVLASGTVLRGDIVNKTVIGRIRDEYKPHVEDMKKIAGITEDEVLAIFTILTSNYTENLLEASACFTGQTAWMIHIPNIKDGFTIMNLAPGPTIDYACQYGIQAFRADTQKPVLIAIIDPYQKDGETRYNLAWSYDKPDSYYWPNPIETPK